MREIFFSIIKQCKIALTLFNINLELRETLMKSALRRMSRVVSPNSNSSACFQLYRSASLRGVTSVHRVLPLLS